MKEVHVCYLTSGWSMLCDNNTDITVHPPHDVYPKDILNYLPLEMHGDFLLQLLTELMELCTFSPKYNLLLISNKNDPGYNEATLNK